MAERLASVLNGLSTSLPLAFATGMRRTAHVRGQEAGASSQGAARGSQEGEQLTRQASSAPRYGYLGVESFHWRAQILTAGQNHVEVSLPLPDAA